MFDMIYHNLNENIITLMFLEVLNRKIAPSNRGY